MKVYISVDIEGVAGATSWPSTVLGDQEHKALAREMTLEAVAACQGALEAGASQIYVKDAHDSGRNLDISLFPKEAKIILGWDNSPDFMVCGLDSTFDALLYVGYHSPGGTNGSPLNHTMSRRANSIKLNGQVASEFLLHAYLAASLGVPSVFLSGDQLICSHAKACLPNITTAAVKEGLGSATVNLAPSLAQELIREGAKQALANPALCQMEAPESLALEINFRDHFRALKASYYPGVRLVDEFTVSFTGAIDEIMTAIMFVL